MRVNKIGKYQKDKLQKSYSLFIISIVFFSNLAPIFPLTTFAEGEEAAPTDPAPVQVVTDPVKPVENPAPVVVDPDKPVDPTPVDLNQTTTPPSTTDTSTQAVVDTSGQASSTPLLLESSTTSATTTDTTASTTEPFASTSIPQTFNGTTTSTDGFNLASSTTPASSTVILNNSSTTGTTTLPDGTVTIDTGNAEATANVLNLLNTTSVNSTGTIQMSNIVGTHEGDVDLRGSSSGGGGGGGVCTLTGCSGVDTVTANISSGATITNALVLQAGSGANLISTSSGAVINTGNALTGLNLVNLANTNFIDSNYYLLTLNSFGGIHGDIVLPALKKFITNLITSGNYNVHTIQSADLENNLDVGANSGNNAAENSLSSVVNSGQADSYTNVYNNLNTNLFGGKSVAILLRVTGKWLGKVLGLPEGSSFIKDGDMYTLDLSDASNGNIALLDNTDVNSTSTAKILNDVKMLSDTGNNLTKDTNFSVINSGNAISAANVVNMGNTNIIGRNWVLAIINIFGDLEGDIVFGRPDLWVGQEIQKADFVANGYNLGYKIKVKNIGDMDATNVNLATELDIAHLDLLTADYPHTVSSGGGWVFQLGNLAPGEEKDINLNTIIKNSSPGIAISSRAVASENEKDNNLSDNTDVSTITTYNPGGGAGGGSTVGTNGYNPILPVPQNEIEISASNFQVTRDTKIVNITTLNSTAHEKVTVKNISNQSIQGVKFSDIIKDVQGVQIHREDWDLGEVLAHEEVTLSYDVTFAASAALGEYFIVSEVKYLNQSAKFPNNGRIFLTKAETVALATTTATTTSLAGFVKPTPKIKYQGPDYTPDSFGNIAYADPEPTSLVAAQNKTDTLFNWQNIYYSLLFLIGSFFSTMYMLVKDK